MTTSDSALPRQRRPTLWIALTIAFGLVAAGTVQHQLADAQKRVDAAGQKLAAAAGSAKSRAQAEVAAAKSSVVVTCARAAAGALGTLGSGSGELRGRLAAAVDEIKVLGPQCKTPFAST